MASLVPPLCPSLSHLTSSVAFSFLLPLILRMLHEATPTQREEDGPKAVILTPTRELCMQLEEQTQQIVQGVQFQSGMEECPD